MTPINCYATEHVISQTVMTAFARGCRGNLVYPSRLLKGMTAAYGILRGTGEMFKRCELVHRPFLHIDLGYFRRSSHNRGDFSGYYRATWDGYQYDWPEEGRIWPEDRWKKLKIRLKDWKTTGSKVLVVPFSADWGHFIGLDPSFWVRAVCDEIRLNTDREIAVLNKHSAPLHEQINEAWAVVVHNSNSAIDALVEGVPVFTLGDSAAWPMGLDDLSKIENPLRDIDRERFFRGLACQQWTLDEFESGEAWDYLKKGT